MHATALKKAKIHFQLVLRIGFILDWLRLRCKQVADWHAIIFVIRICKSICRTIGCSQSPLEFGFLFLCVSQSHLGSCQSNTGESSGACSSHWAQIALCKQTFIKSQWSRWEMKQRYKYVCLVFFFVPSLPEDPRQEPRVDQECLEAPGYPGKTVPHQLVRKTIINNLFSKMMDTQNLKCLQWTSKNENNIYLAQKICFAWFEYTGSQKRSPGMTEFPLVSFYKETRDEDFQDLFTLSPLTPKPGSPRLPLGPSYPRSPWKSKKSGKSDASK